MPNYKDFRRNLKIIHDFTDSLIRKRKEDLRDEDFGQGKKNRLAFLDLLLKAAEGDQLSIKDMRDEVRLSAKYFHLVSYMLLSS